MVCILKGMNDMWVEGTLVWEEVVKVEEKDGAGEGQLWWWL